ncbi:hypothetical protein BVRB_4g097470 [Beta vulgaris subsp. vulgaris]|uniref:Uncharacterized protein n=1 Tax=Beta vulgaris subsp. vulgaris TaxID=3555 RepID=A0A0J8BCY0_BETVV|nr:hypothetical protein BVRB_4g097470 [Beta vulgaris subsp. vulgaris]
MEIEMVKLIDVVGVVLQVLIKESSLNPLPNLPCAIFLAS